jgi:ribonuclease-3
MINKLETLQRHLGYRFNNEKLLTQALTHRSVKGEHNERLEFLGDSILNFIIGHALYQKLPYAKEGDLSRYRASLVCEETLAELAVNFDLGEYLILGVGELRAGGFRRKSILADALEAIIAAVYLDSDLLTVQHLVELWFVSRLNDVATVKVKKDPKSRLQEYLQAQKFPLPVYKVVDVVGADHDQTFYVECSVDGMSEVAKGHGSSRKIAEQIAAENFLKEVLKQ